MERGDERGAGNADAAERNANPGELNFAEKKGEADVNFAEQGDDSDLSAHDADADFSARERAGDLGEIRAETESGEAPTTPPKAETSRDARKNRVRRGRERADDGDAESRRESPAEAEPRRENGNAEKSEAGEPDAEKTHGRLKTEKKPDKLPAEGERKSALRFESETPKKGEIQDVKKTQDKGAAKPFPRRVTWALEDTSKKGEIEARPAPRRGEWESRPSAIGERGGRLKFDEKEKRLASSAFRTEGKGDKKTLLGGNKDKKTLSDRIDGIRSNISGDSVVMGENVGVKAGNTMVNAGVKATALSVKAGAAIIKGVRGRKEKKAGKLRKKAGKLREKAGDAKERSETAADKSARTKDKALNTLRKAEKAASRGVDAANRGVDAAKKGVEASKRGPAATQNSRAAAANRSTGRAGGAMEESARFTAEARRNVLEADRLMEKRERLDGRALRLNEKSERFKQKASRADSKADSLSDGKRTKLVKKKGMGRKALKAPVNASKTLIKNALKKRMIQNGNRTRGDEFGAGVMAFATKPFKKLGIKLVKALVKAVASIVLKIVMALIPVLIPVIIVVILIMIIGGGSGTAGQSKADPEEINAVEVLYGKLEAELRLEIENAEEERDGYDEYRYDIGDIGHDPYELIAYLSARYGAFRMDNTLMDFPAVVKGLFKRQYTLTYTPTTETRYADPYDTDGDGDYEPYDRKVLTVKLTVRPQSVLFAADLDAEEKVQYDLLIMTKGGKQAVGSPFDFGWLYSITSDYGYYVYGGDIHFTNGVTISAPLGTDVLAGVDGTVSEAQTGTANAGPYIVLRSGDDNKYVTVKYGLLSDFSVSVGQEVKTGDIIGKTGASGLYFEITYTKESFINSVKTTLSPLLFADTKTNGAPVPIYGEVPLPMGDGSLAAFLTEAQSHLGVPYYFYTVVPTTPPASFNCSSFVNYVLNRSGVMRAPFTDAMHIYLDSCVPITEDYAMPGDLVFFHSTYSTSKFITHVGIYLGGGQMVHSGNPNKIVSINTAYWREHLYAFARLKTT